MSKQARTQYTQEFRLETLRQVQKGQSATDCTEAASQQMSNAAYAMALLHNAGYVDATITR